MITERHLGIDPTPMARGLTHGIFVGDGLGDGARRTSDVHKAQFVFAWREILELAAVEPWPALRMRWKTPGGSDERIIELEPTWFERASHVTMDDVVGQLFDHVAVRNVPHERGWAAHARVLWETVERWPGRPSGDGGYRTAASDLVVASRGAPTAMEILRAWWVLGPGSASKIVPREIALTRDHVYAREAGRMARLPLSDLRAVWDGPSGHVVCEFGLRTTFLTFPSRPECELETALRAKLD